MSSTQAPQPPVAGQALHNPLDPNELARSAGRAHARIDEGQRLLAQLEGRVEYVNKALDTKDSDHTRRLQNLERDFADLQKSRHITPAHIMALIAIVSVACTALGFAFFTRTEGQYLAGRVDTLQALCAPKEPGHGGR